MDKLYVVAIGERIRRLRESQRVSQQKLAKELKLSHASAISMYESGKRHLPVEVLLAYSKRFDVSTDWILKGEAS